MGQILIFLSEAVEDGAVDQTQTAEALLTSLSKRADCDSYIRHFLQYSCKNALLNLSVCEMLAGKRSAERQQAFGLDHLQARSLARPFHQRLEVVVREARHWEELSEKARIHKRVV